MYSVEILTTGGDPDDGLLWALVEEGVEYAVVSSVDALSPNVDAVLLDMSVCGRDMVPSVAERCAELRVPLLCALPAEYLPEYGASWGASDFFLLPPRKGEVGARIRQALAGDSQAAGDQVLQVGDLRVDLERYEVFNRGRKVLLTFKEYQLLCLLASNPGRVFSRESLLNQIWEYDYYGGTRTVDVHIRRLRSKIEDTGHTYIETVWNVGYRFRSQGSETRGA